MDGSKAFSTSENSNPSFASQPLIIWGKKDSIKIPTVPVLQWRRLCSLIDGRFAGK